MGIVFTHKPPVRDGDEKEWWVKEMPSPTINICTENRLRKPATTL